MTEIINNLWLGHEDHAKQQDTYDLIVNCTANLPFFDDKSHNIRIAVNDIGSPSQIEQFKDNIFPVLESIDQYLKNNKKVLVHCQAGQSRSPTVIASYLLYSDPNLTVDNAITFLRRRSSDAFFGRLNFRCVMEHVRTQASHVVSGQHYGYER